MSKYIADICVKTGTNQKTNKNFYTKVGSMFESRTKKAVGSTSLWQEKNSNLSRNRQKRQANRRSK